MVALWAALPAPCFVNEELMRRNIYEYFLLTLPRISDSECFPNLFREGLLSRNCS